MDDDTFLLSCLHRFPDPGVRPPTRGQGWVPMTTGSPFSSSEARRPHSRSYGPAGTYVHKVITLHQRIPGQSLFPITKSLPGVGHLLLSWRWQMGQPHPSCRPHPSQAPVSWGPDTLRAVFLAPLASRGHSPAPAQTSPGRPWPGPCRKAQFCPFLTLLILSLGRRLGPRKA